MWGVTWLDHLRLILPLGIALLLLLRYLLAARQPPDEAIHVLRPAPWETRRSAPGASNTFDVVPLLPSTHAGPNGLAPSSDDAGTGGFAESPEPSHAGRFAEMPAYPEPLTGPRDFGQADAELELAAPPAAAAHTSLATEPESPTMSPFLDDAPTIRMVMHEGSPIEFLPGRLEILEGLPNDQEFRFQRVVGGGTPEVTLGRAPGPAYRHIQLSAPTVSRVHARMRFENDRWVIHNLSEANPLYVRGELMAEPHVLVDGDELRIGEVLLRYRDGRA